MHELALVEEIVRVAEHGAKGSKVKLVRLEVGRLAAVQLDALRFCFTLAIEGTLLESSTLEINEVPGTGHCSRCDRDTEMPSPLTTCACGAGLEWKSGDRLRVTQLEVV